MSSTNSFQSALAATAFLCLGGLLSLGAQEIDNSDSESRTRIKPETEDTFFFGDTESFETIDSGSLLNGQFADEGQSSAIEESHGENHGQWVEQDISDLFPELSILDDVSSEKSLERLKTARQQYDEARRTLRAGDLAARTREQELLDETAGRRKQGTWVDEEHKERIRKHKENLLARYRMEAVGQLVRAMQVVDSIKNPSIMESDQYLDLKSSIYREYVKQQFRSRNLHHCIEILEAYLRLRPEHAKEPEAHRLLAACYRNQEVIAARMRSHKTSLHFKSK